MKWNKPFFNLLHCLLNKCSSEVSVFMCKRLYWEWNNVCPTRKQGQSQILGISTRHLKALCTRFHFRSCAAPLPRVVSWGENTACTSGGDPGCTGVSCGKGHGGKDALESLHRYIHVRLEGVTWSKCSWLQTAACPCVQQTQRVSTEWNKRHGRSAVD